MARKKEIDAVQERQLRGILRQRRLIRPLTVQIVLAIIYSQIA